MKANVINMCLFVFLLGSLGIWGCRDIIEVDIRNAQIQIYTPSNHATSSTLRQTFDWEDLDGARTYRVQCVQNSFDSSAIFVFDTIVSKSQFAYTMQVGNFQWRVQAKNNGYVSPYVVSSFRIDSTNNLALQLVVLVSPASGTYFNTNARILMWETIPLADSFVVQIDTTGFVNPSFYLTKTKARNTSTNSNDTIVVHLPPRNNAYQWRVKAKNKNTSTDFSATWNFYIDQTPPVAPTLVSPAYGITVTASTTSFSWTRNASDISYDSLYLYRSDSISLVSSYPKQVSAVTSSIPLLSKDSTYYWRVKSIDKAGNVGPFPDKRFRFKVSF